MEQDNINQSENSGVINLDEEDQPETSQNSNRKHKVWEFFKVDSEKKKWWCLVCKVPNKWTYTTKCPSITRAKEHLKAAHPKQNKILEEAEKNRHGKASQQNGP